MPSQIPTNIDFKPIGGGTPITSLPGGDSVQVTVTMDSAPTSDENVLLTASGTHVITHPGGANPNAPLTLTVPANSASVSVNLTTTSVSSNTIVQFSASANETTIYANLTLTP